MNEIKVFKFLIVFLPFAFCLFISPTPLYAVTNPVSYEITVSATLGEPKLTLFGYSSPHSLVQLHGERVAEEVIADNQGYFLFDRAFLPYPNPQYPELCLNAIDTQSRISFPICLPPLPTGPFNFNIGPVLLAPTFSLEKGSFLPQEQIKAEGLTIPNSEVTVFLANDSETPRMVARQRPRLLRGGIAHAYSLPQYKIKSDSQGRFEFSLPTVKPNNWRLFTAAKFQGSPTPKSNTLNFKILNWWQWLLLIITNLLGAFLRLIKPFWWLLLICLELIIIIGLLVNRSRNKFGMTRKS
ncbi:hypothetical protein COY29_02745 [Candidatus Woesebacteria bacterium CG_4_10_14_0_2_um_filter_39_14]|uniref:Uncharacterized protein n=2 Tax=Microgenomates group TaxID=1794810 RepID=A0A2M7TMU3_9BACT|nr:MAG: hypothetical protein COY29_02745 [Candidatus Woesebacteria bacterium CG_4_10_14_0_2_um_filter_39_14]